MTDPIARAYELLEQQDMEGAIAALNSAAGADAAGLQGDLFYERAQWAPAFTAFARALAVEPENPQWLRGAVGSLRHVGRYDEAMELCGKLLAVRADDAAAHRHMAWLCLHQGGRAAALDHAREARFLAPFDLAGLAEMADVMAAADEGLAAVEMLDSALRQAHPADPALPVAWVSLGRAWAGLAEPEKAADAFRVALDIDAADTAGAGRLLAELHRAPVAEELPASFVRALFDTYADRFDRELVGKLRYDAPSALSALLRDNGFDGRVPCRILDAGCGTGLAGIAVRDLAGYLAGFDLAPRMVEKARARGIYDNLWVGELVESLNARPDSYDLVVAADVLVYLGDLVPVMAAVAATLSPGGAFVFTCERTEAAGFLLHEGRRFAHSEGHIRAAAAAAGLAICHLAPYSPRIDRGEPVPGWIGLVKR